MKFLPRKKSKSDILSVFTISKTKPSKHTKRGGKVKAENPARLKPKLKQTPEPELRPESKPEPEPEPEPESPLHSRPPRDKATSVDRPRINFNEKVNVLSGDLGNSSKARHYVIKLKSDDDFRRGDAKDLGRGGERCDAGDKTSKEKKKAEAEEEPTKSKKLRTTRRANKAVKNLVYQRHQKRLKELEEHRQDKSKEVRDGRADLATKSFMEQLRCFHPYLLSGCPLLKANKVRTVFPPATNSKKTRMFLEGRMKRFQRHTDIFQKLKNRSLLKSLNYKPFELVPPGANDDSPLDLPCLCDCDAHGAHDSLDVYDESQDAYNDLHDSSYDVCDYYGGEHECHAYGDCDEYDQLDEESLPCLCPACCVCQDGNDEYEY